MQRRTLNESEAEVVFYGRTSLPFPFRDREATERYCYGPICEQLVKDLNTVGKLAGSTETLAP